MNDPASSLRRKGRANRRGPQRVEIRDERAQRRRACPACAAALPVTARSLAVPARSGCCAGSLPRSRARPNLPERTAVRSRSARRAGKARSASGASVRISSVRAWFPPSFRPRQSRPSGRPQRRKEAGASLATETKRRSASALAPNSRGTVLPGRKKDAVGEDGGGGKTRTGGSRIDEPRGRASPARGAANEVMSFQEGEDGRERQAACAIYSCWRGETSRADRPPVARLSAFAPKSRPDYAKPTLRFGQPGKRCLMAGKTDGGGAVGWRKESCEN
jgi:hypothetical protein